jgi:hypothetical protein
MSSAGLERREVCKPTLAACIQRSHVENVHALHLSQNLQSLQTGRLLQIRGDGSYSCSGTEEVGFALDLCLTLPSAPIPHFQLSTYEQGLIEFRVGTIHAIGGRSGVIEGRLTLKRLDLIFIAAALWYRTYTISTLAISSSLCRSQSA